MYIALTSNQSKLFIYSLYFQEEPQEKDIESIEYCTSFTLSHWLHGKLIFQYQYRMSSCS